MLNLDSTLGRLPEIALQNIDIYILTLYTSTFKNNKKSTTLTNTHVTVVVTVREDYY